MNSLNFVEKIYYVIYILNTKLGMFKISVLPQLYEFTTLFDSIGINAYYSTRNG